MNLPLNKPSHRGGGNSGGVGFGGPCAPSERTFTVGEVGFGRSWQDEEPGLRALYEEAQAQIAIYEVERGILEKDMRRLRERAADTTLQNNELREVMAEIVTWVEDDLRETVDAGYRAAVEKAQKLTEGIR